MKALEEPSDGLLRGSRKDRIAQMLSLREAEWNLYTLLDLHLGLLDHAEEVRLAAVESLPAAAKIPEPITLTPADFLARYMFSFTSASGAAPQIFEFLVELGTPEAIRSRTSHGMRTSRPSSRLSRTTAGRIFCGNCLRTS